MFSRRKELQAGEDQLEQFLEDARTFAGVEAHDVADMHVRTDPDERVFLCMQGASLIELEDDGGESARDAAEVDGEQDAKPVRYRFGATTRATTGPDVALDRGEFVVTTKRAVFLGTKQIRQWHWSKLASVAHSPAGPWTVIDVSNRERTFGVRYDDEHQDRIRFGIDLAVANAQGTREALVRRLGDELDATRSVEAAG